MTNYFQNISWKTVAIRIFSFLALIGIVLALIAGLIVVTNSCTTGRPDCTVRETAPGVFKPYGDCDNCSEITVLNYNGTQRTMDMQQAAGYVQQYPPTVGYSGGDSYSGLNNFLLYHYLFNSPSYGGYYQQRYAPQYNTYVSYNRVHHITPRAYTTRSYSTPTPSNRYSSGDRGWSAGRAASNSSITVNGNNNRVMSSNGTSTWTTTRRATTTANSKPFRYSDSGPITPRPTTGSWSTVSRSASSGWLRSSSSSPSKSYSGSRSSSGSSGSAWSSSSRSSSASSRSSFGASRSSSRR